MMNNNSCIATRLTLILLVCLLFLLIPGSSANALTADQTITVKSDPEQAINVRFRLFETDNIYTHLLLDTATGKVWQVVRKSTDSRGMVIPINNTDLIAEDGQHIGRFTLYPSYNMWTFLLLDQDDGRLWECYFSMDKARGIVRLESKK